jgi:hypothetical protein
VKAMPVPHTRFQQLVRRLVAEAMSVCHHDTEWESEQSEPGGRHEAERLTVRFTFILRGKVRG